MQPRTGDGVALSICILSGVHAGSQVYGATSAARHERASIAPRRRYMVQGTFQLRPAPNQNVEIRVATSYLLVILYFRILVSQFYYIQGWLK